jgi:hypothetical protein
MADSSGKQGDTSGSGGQTSGDRDSGQSDAVIGEAQVAVSGRAGEMSQVISSGEEARRRRGKTKDKETKK